MFLDVDLTMLQGNFKRYLDRVKQLKQNRLFQCNEKKNSTDKKVVNAQK